MGLWRAGSAPPHCGLLFTSFLFGEGSLRADFDTNSVAFDLHMDDMLGSDFVDITATNLRMDSGSTSTPHFYNTQSSATTFNYYTSALEDATYRGEDEFAISGYFYGPSAQEVGGSISLDGFSFDFGGPDGDPTTYDSLDVDFIGIRQ